ncbi:proline-rich protein 29-like [Acipenser ruthenus]|uniref:proline-rich protein 29-like n=1 Tax=Acipenser ruthenus TaxID=7906 RepID=UPI00145A3B61|nr:proline-rich protein 29-like [Acipenser ruthenus]
MAWTDGNNYYPAQTWNQDSERMQIIQQPIPQQPTMIIQQLPSAMPPAALPFRPGHIKEDLVELMMIQNAQMHQVIMNNMTMSAMSAFGYSHPTPQPSVEPPRVPIIVEEEEPESVYHHHYEPLPFPTYPTWLQQPQMPVRQNQDPVVRHVNHDRPASVHKDLRAVPPPPPPSATRTVGADIPPAAEYYDATEGRL